MTQVDPGRPQPPAFSDSTIALCVYVLYFIGYFTGITAVIGVIVAHVKIGTGDPMLDTHYRFQIYTFWVGLLYLVIGTVLLLVLVGFVVYAWWFIWSLIRNIKGTLLLNENRPVPNPTSWMFG